MTTENERNAAVQLSQSLGNTIYALRHLEVSPDAIRDFVNVSIATYADANDALYNADTQERFQMPVEEAPAEAFLYDAAGQNVPDVSASATTQR
jgi:hypothetical protein